MHVDFKDYYGILGVAPDADEKAIKKAYHQLAKKHHPDVNPGDKAAEEKFKEVTEAYQALNGAENRKKYDELRENYQQWQARGGRGDFDYGRWQAQSADGRGYTYSMSPEEFAEMFGDLGGGGFHGSQGGFSDFFSTIFGMGSDGVGGGHQTRRPHVRRQSGQDAEAAVRITLEEAFQGTTRFIDTGEKRIEAKIPRGVKTGSKVRLAGQGGPGIGGGSRGDLYLRITVEPHSWLERQGDDLTVELPVDIYTAVLGGEVSVHTLSGDVLLKVPPHSQAGKTFRLKGKGMPKLEANGDFGDLYAKIRLILPENLSAKEIETFRELATLRRRRQG